jgi:tetratricopeptide (TPR) repeat protein
MAVSKASAEAMGSLIQSFVSPSGQENKNLNTNFMNKLSDFSGIPALVPLVEDLWLRTLQKNNGDAIAEYEAGRFFLRTGKTEKAYELFVSARKKMRAFGDILPYLAVAAEKTGRADEAKEYRIQACYLLGGERFAGMCAEILDGK